MNESLEEHSIEAEQAVLGAMLSERDAVIRAAKLLTSSDFYLEQNKRIYRAVIRLFDNAGTIDLLTVGKELDRVSQLSSVGGSEYLSVLLKEYASRTDVSESLTIVREKSVLRQMVKEAEDIASWSRNNETKVDILDDDPKICRTNLTHIKPLMVRAYDQIERHFQHRGEASGISTGFIDLDDITSGLQPSELIVLASVPQMGKSSLSRNIAHHIALKLRLPVAIFSLESTQEQVVQSLICAEASIKSQDLRRGSIRDADWHRVTNAVNNLYQSPIFINDTPNISDFEISVAAKNLCLEHGLLGLIVIDYIQLVRASGDTENRTQEVGQIVRELKVLARELKVPILLLSQLSRAVEQREDKRPMLSDIRDSGTVSEDADVVAFIYRPSYYKRKRINEADPDEGVAEVIIGKQRNGPVGTIRLGFQPEYARFTNLSRNFYGGDY